MEITEKERYLWSVIEYRSMAQLRPLTAEEEKAILEKGHI